MADMKETYTLMFTDYPDIVNLVQMRKMLGGISYQIYDGRTVGIFCYHGIIHKISMIS